MTTIDRNEKGEVRVDGELALRVPPGTLALGVLGYQGGITKRFVLGADSVPEMNPDVGYVYELNYGSNVPSEMRGGRGSSSFYFSKWTPLRVARALIACDRRHAQLVARGERIFEEIHRLGRAAMPVPFRHGCAPLPVPAPNWMHLKPFMRHTVDGEERSIEMGRWHGAPVLCEGDTVPYDPEKEEAYRGGPYPTPTPSTEEWAAGLAWALQTNAWIRQGRAKRLFEAMLVAEQSRSLAASGLPRAGTSRRLEVVTPDGSVVAWWRTRETHGYGSARKWEMFLPFEIVR